MNARFLRGEFLGRFLKKAFACGRQVASPTDISRIMREQGSVKDVRSFKPSPGGAEGEKKGCYPFFNGFRRQTPDFVEPTGDDKITVSTSLVSRSDR